MGRKRRIAIGLGTAAGALAVGRRYRPDAGREDRFDDLIRRGEEVWTKLRGLRQRLPDVGELRERLPEIGELRQRLPDVGALRQRLPDVRFGRREGRSMFDRLLNRFTLGFGVGYVLGARAGRERYEQLVRSWEKFAGSPVVRQATAQGKSFLGEAQDKLSGQIRERRQPQHVRDVMTPLPMTIKASDTVAAAANNMRQIDVGSMIVVDDSGRVVGIVTDRDIAVRAVAQGRDPQTTTVGEIYSEELTTLSPSDSVDDAVRVMRDKAIRRLPVVEDERPVGIVSIGDLAFVRDPRSALADISAEPPNR